MYRILELQNELNDSVGLKQNKNPRYTNLDSDIVVTATGLTINHPLVTVENVNQTLEESDPDYYEEFSLVKTYSIDELVKVSTGPKIAFFKSLVNANLGNIPATSPIQWEQFDPVSTYLREIKKESVNEAVEDVMIHKKIHEEIKEVFENVTIHKGAGRLTDKEVKENRFVGYELTILGQQELTAIINMIGFQFDGAETFNLLVFHSSRHKPIATIPIVLTNTFVFDWIKPATDLILNYSSQEYETGGQFFIGYKESEIVGQAIIKTIDATRRPCHSCNIHETLDWERRFNFLQIRTFSIPESEFINGGMWNIENTRFVTGTNWGLNLDISMRCDLTDYLIRNKRMMSGIIKIKTEMNIINGFLYNSRKGTIPTEIKPKARNELQETENKNSLPIQYKRALKALNFDLTELGSVCFPCQGPRKIRRKVV